MPGPFLKPPAAGGPNSMFRMNPQPGVQASPLVQGYVPYTSRRKIGDFREDFATGSINADVWSDYSSGGSYSVSVSGGAVMLTMATTDAGGTGTTGIRARELFDIRESGLYFAWPAAISGTGVPSVNFGIESAVTIGIFKVAGTFSHTPSFRILWDSKNQLEIVVLDVAGGQTGVTAAYNATTMAWMRFREANGTLFFDRAPDSSGIPGAWTNIHSVSTRAVFGGYPITNCFMEVEANRSNTSTAITISQQAKYDSFNVTLRTTSGALSLGPSDQVDSTGSRFRTFTATGDIAPVPASETSTSNRFRAFGTSGDLSVWTASISGDSSRTGGVVVTHTGTGDLTNFGALITGTASRFRTFTATGSINPAPASITGADNRFRTFTATGTIQPAPASITGADNRFRAFSATGSINPAPASMTGADNRFRAFSSSGALNPAPASMTGADNRFRAFTATGALQPTPASMTGADNRFRAFSTSGALSIQWGSIAGAATDTSVVFQDATYTYLVAGIVITDLAESYTVTAEVHADLAETYLVAAPTFPVFQDRVYSYEVIRTVSADCAQSYLVLDQFGTHAPRWRWLWIGTGVR